MRTSPKARRTAWHQFRLWGTSSQPGLLCSEKGSRGKMGTSSHEGTRKRAESQPYADWGPPCVETGAGIENLKLSPALVPVCGVSCAPGWTSSSSHELSHLAATSHWGPFIFKFMKLNLKFGSSVTWATFHILDCHVWLMAPSLVSIAVENSVGPSCYGTISLSWIKFLWECF